MNRHEYTYCSISQKGVITSFNQANPLILQITVQTTYGRVYDPVIGRFLSPDNIVQSPEFTQSYNRYSYAFNNPLRFTDPSGNEGLGEDMIFHWLNQGYPIDVVFMIMDGADPASAMENYIRMVVGFVISDQSGGGGDPGYSYGYLGSYAEMQDRMEESTQQLLFEISIREANNGNLSALENHCINSGITLTVWDVVVSESDDKGWRVVAESAGGATLIVGEDYRSGVTGAQYYDTDGGFMSKSISSAAEKEGSIGTNLGYVNDVFSAVQTVAGGAEIFTRANAGTRIAYTTFNGASATVSSAKVAGAFKAASNFTFGASIAVDLTLSFIGQQSWGKTIVNTTVGGAAIAIGGVPGMVVGASYLIMDKAGMFEGPSGPMNYTPPSIAMPDATRVVQPMLRYP